MYLNSLKSKQNNWNFSFKLNPTWWKFSIVIGHLLSSEILFGLRFASACENVGGQLFESMGT
jgi:hypothetical protein